MREVCRNFQRGSCQYGERCRYLHQQQQRKSNVHGFGGQFSSHQQQNTNPFGFGSHAASGSQQQQKTNPFGFGMQNSSSQLNRGPHSEFKPNQSKPFENKWNRFSSKPQNGTSRQSDNHSQPVNHKCTDPEICKRQIAEDFEQEKPLWILTCYSHCKGAPCDIVGDISYEELRAAAYEDAKNGMNLQSIVEKERNILKSKLVEFEKLLSEPYKMPLNSSLDNQNHQSIRANANAFSPTTQNNGPLSVSQNHQFNGANANAFSPTTQNNGPLSVSQNHQFIGANANAFLPTTQNNGPLSVSSFSQLGASLSLGFERPSAAPLMNTPAQPSSFGSGGNFLTSNTSNLFGSGISSAQSSPFSKPVDLTMFPGSTSQFQQSPIAIGNTSFTTTMLQTTSDVQLNKPQEENVSVDASIWLKDKWNPGEIPEEAPPDRFVR